MKRLLVTSALMMSFATSASILVEPYLGYGVGKFEKTSAGVTDEYTLNGPTYGARLGAQYLGVMAGLDASLGTLSMKGDSSSVKSFDKSADATTFGIFAGYNLPILLRAWAAYYFKHDLEVGTTTYSGSGMAAGLGYTGLPFVSLNVEYRKMTIDEWEIGSTSGKYTDEPTESTLLFSVSAPFTFL